MSTCQLLLENYSGRYCTGSWIRGKVRTIWDSDSHVFSVKIRFIGREFTTQPSAHHRPAFSEDNIFLKHNMTLYQSDAILPAGNDSFPFSYKLPDNLPSSYNSALGTVSYKVEAVVQKQINQYYKDQLEFCVMAVIDSKKVRGALRSSVYQHEIRINCLCCASGYLDLDIEVSKKLILPGDIVNFVITLTNTSRIDVRGIKLALKQKIKVVVGHASNQKEEVITICETSDLGVPSQTEGVYNLKLHIPIYHVFPSFNQCVIFKAKHYYEIELDLPKPYGKKIATITPIVGNLDESKPRKKVHVAASKSTIPAYSLKKTKSSSSRDSSSRVKLKPSISDTGSIESLIEGKESEIGLFQDYQTTETKSKKTVYKGDRASVIEINETKVKKTVHITDSGNSVKDPAKKKAKKGKGSAHSFKDSASSESFKRKQRKK